LDDEDAMIAPSYPLLLHLPQGHAHYAGLIDGQPRYTLDGALLDVDVTIPGDIADYWFWHGSFLRLNVVPGEPGWSISTGTFGVEGAFAIARRHAQREHAQATTVVQLRMF
jgi:hypothetical protein